MTEGQEYDGSELLSKLESFFEKSRSGIKKEKRSETSARVIVITSGGTAVNMDVFGIRFIDNFSTGTRGSQIAEFFLLNGYLVVFLSRKTGNMPYLRALQDKSDPYRLLENVTLNKDSTMSLTPGTDFRESFLKDLENYKKYKDRLLLVDFTTLNEYREKLKLVQQFIFLRVIVKFVQKYKENVAYCLCAAVSDFSLGDDAIMKEKLSSKNKVNVLLVPVPKVRDLVRELSDERPMVCCFKMSTNRTDMDNAASAMLSKPTQSDMVVCNIFDERLTKVSVLHSDGSSKFLEAAVGSFLIP